MNSKLIKLEREISLITNQIQSKVSSWRFKIPIQISRTARQEFAAFVNFWRVRGKSTAIQFEKLTNLVIRERPFSAKPLSRRPTSKPAVSPKHVRPEFPKHARPESSSMLIKLEREIGLITNQIQRKMSSWRFKIPNQISRTARQEFAAFVNFWRVRGKSTAIQFQQLRDLVIREVSFSAKPLGKRPASKPAVSPNRVRPQFPKPVGAERAKIGAQAPIWICLGLVIVCVVVCLTLLIQMRSLTHEMLAVNRESAETKLRVDRLEKHEREISDIQSKSSSQNASVMHSPTQPPPLILRDTDITIIRQFIRVAPPPLDSKSQINVGDPSAGINATPVPEALSNALPQLRGAKFSTDQNSSIILIVAGSERVDAVIAYR